MLRTDHSQIAYLQYLPVKKVGRLKPNGGEGGGGERERERERVFKFAGPMQARFFGHWCGMVFHGQGDLTRHIQRSGIDAEFWGW